MIMVDLICLVLVSLALLNVEMMMPSFGPYWLFGVHCYHILHNLLPMQLLLYREHSGQNAATGTWTGAVW